jgi:hypothetical protein
MTVEKAVLNPPLEYKWPNKSRFEIRAENEKSVRVFDGAIGWKMRAAGSAVPSVP